MKFRSFHWMRFMPAIPWTRRTLRALLLYIVTPYLALLFLLFVFQLHFLTSHSFTR